MIIMKEWQKQQNRLMFGPDANVDTTNKATQIILSNMPKRLYKYRAASVYSLASLEQNYIIASRLDTFNDIFEAPIDIPEEVMAAHLYNFYTSYTRLLDGVKQPPPKTLRELSALLIESFLQDDSGTETLSEIKEKSEKSITDLMRKIHFDLVQKMQTQYNVFCMSEKIDNELMWAHYADNHKGFCIAYDMTKTDNSSAEFLRQSTLPVYYENEKYISLNNLEINNEMSGRFCMEASTIKSKAWSYEKEWRTFFVSREKNQKESFLPVVAIYLGARIDESTESLLHNICQSKNIPMYRMVPDVKRHKLIALKIK